MSTALQSLANEINPTNVRYLLNVVASISFEESTPELCVVVVRTVLDKIGSPLWSDDVLSAALDVLGKLALQANEDNRSYSTTCREAVLGLCRFANQGLESDRLVVRSESSARLAVKETPTVTIHRLHVLRRCAGSTARHYKIHRHRDEMGNARRLDIGGRR